MPLPCPSGQISLGDIQGEFGGSNPISINEYYRNGGLVPSSATRVPTSGQISFSDFFCTLAEYVLTISSNTTNLNLQTAFNNAFGSSAWSSSVPKRLIINSGVIVGATNTSNYAINSPSGRGSTLRIDNNGSIQGAGGAANSGTGGNAIFAGSSGISINNLGSIYAGGGGGGRGGQGGSGSFTSTSDQWANNDGCNNSSGAIPDETCNWDYACKARYGSTAYCYSIYNVCGGYGGCGSGSCNNYYACGAPTTECGSCRVTVYTTVPTSGGAGGNGGVGRGYNQAAGSGSAGSAGGTGAGTGGTGGSGGDWGASGSTGGTGSNGNTGSGLAGSAGGAAGFYIVNNGNVTWISNGTRAGRVG